MPHTGPREPDDDCLERGTGVFHSESGSRAQQIVRHHAQDLHGVKNTRGSPCVFVWKALLEVLGYCECLC